MNLTAMRRAVKMADVQRREQHKRDHAISPNLRSAYPQLTQLRLDLTFSDGTSNPPAAQGHVLAPAARAFFRFPCPHSDCSGIFDLSIAVESLVRGSALSKQGTFECVGTRAFDRATEKRCGLALRF